MKIKKLGTVMAMALALVSCKNEPAKEPEQQKMKYPVALSLDGSKAGAMRATEKSNSLSASYQNERAIENLTVVVFLSNNSANTPVAVEKVITYDKLTKPADPYQGEFKFDMGMAGTYQLEVIANGYKDDSDKEAFINQFKQGVSYEQFKKIVFERTLPNNGETGFAMLSTEPTKVTTLANETAHAGTIKLRRLACRFDVFNKLTDKLKLTKVTLQNQTDKSYLMTQTDVPTGADGGAKEYTANGDWFNATLVSGGIYSYENPVKGAVKLKLEGEYDGQAWEKTIELRDKNGNYVATQRNHIYRVHLTKGNGTTPGGGDNGGGKDDPANADKINYVIEVLDWDEDASMDYEDNDVWSAELFNPLTYVAEANINQTGDGFVTDLYAANVSGYFNYDTAMAKFKNITLDGINYHLPSLFEWMAIVPFSYEYVLFSQTANSTNVEEDVIIEGKEVKCRQDFKGEGNGICYALRFKGTKYQTAWKYEVVTKQGYTSPVMRITSRVVMDGITVDEIATDAFWQQNKAKDIVRIFPASGYSYGNSNTPNIGGGRDGYFLSSTKYAAPNEPIERMVHSMGFNKNMTFSDFGGDDEQTCGRSVRLFKDTL